MLSPKRTPRSPSLSSEAGFLEEVFHGPQVHTFLGIRDHSLVRERLQPLLATTKFSTSPCVPLSQALGRCPGAKNIESPQ